MIHFGTDGWRAVIGEEFTFENVRRVAQAVADELREQVRGRRPWVVVGYDTRFLSDRYAAEVASVLGANDVDVAFSKRDCPTPALSYAVAIRQADGGVMVTASHSPPCYNGLKLEGPDGGPFPRAMMRRVEDRLARNEEAGREPRRMRWGLEDGNRAARQGHGAIERFDPLQPYLEQLRSLVDLQAIAQARTRVVVDPMYGAGRGYLAALLGGLGCPVREIHGDLNPGFGGVHPEPIARNLQSLVETVLDGGYDLGLATDGDADRIGAVDALGLFVNPHRIFALVLQHLVEVRGMRGSVVKTVSTTQHVDALCRRYGLPLRETPMGFDHIAAWMAQGRALIGGEEAGGITIRGHVPQGDGLLMGLLLLEIVAVRGAPLHVLVDDLDRALGPVCYARDDRRTRPFRKQDLVARLLMRAPDRIAGLSVSRVDKGDGVKYYLGEDSWLLIRPSGSEPLLRMYAEAREQAKAKELLQAGATLAEQML